MVRFACPNCHRTLQAPEGSAGATAVCAGCKHQFQIPAPPGPVPYAEIREAPPPTPPQPVPADPDLEPRPRRRPARPSGNWAWRWCSPSALLLALLMLPLPFLEVQCSAPGVNMALLNQTGLDTMTGRYSVDASITRFNNQLRAFGAPVNPAQVPWAPGGPQELKVKSAPLMIAVPFLLLAGMAVGLALRPTALRVPLVAAAIVAALVLVVVQMAVGFPLDMEIRDSLQRAEKELKALGGGFPGGNPFPGPAGGNPFGPKMGVNPFGGPGLGFNPLTEAIQTRYTPVFWLWLVVLVGSLGPLIAEMVWATTRRQRRRWRPAYADDY